MLGFDFAGYISDYFFFLSFYSDRAFSKLELLFLHIFEY